MAFQKRALLIGINKYPAPNALFGCAEDARRLQNFLITKRSFTNSEITMLLDADATIGRIRSEIDKLVSFSNSNTERTAIWISYSGHGLKLPKINANGESDNQDEAIFCVDQTLLVDDEIFTRLCRNLPQTCELFAFFDCCFSGTLFDLPTYSFKAENKNICKSKIIYVGGCSDRQFSAEVSSGGVATTKFLDVMSKSAPSDLKKFYNALGDVSVYGNPQRIQVDTSSSSLTKLFDWMLVGMVSKSRNVADVDDDSQSAIFIDNHQNSDNETKRNETSEHTQNETSVEDMISTIERTLLYKINNAIEAISKNHIIANKRWVTNVRKSPFFINTIISIVRLAELLNTMPRNQVKNIFNFLMFTRIINPLSPFNLQDIFSNFNDFLKVSKLQNISQNISQNNIDIEQIAQGLDLVKTAIDPLKTSFVKLISEVKGHDTDVEIENIEK